MKLRSIFFQVSTIIAILASLAVTTPAHAAGLCYVNDNASGANNGTSWTDAYTGLQSALADPCTEIWVAAGTYKPHTFDRTAPFTLEYGTDIYGGFAGTETLLTQRDWQANLTILSGDVGIPDDASDNSYHVVLVMGNVSTPLRLDGFTITGGHAVYASPEDQGGGMYVYAENSNLTLANLVFDDNSASYTGGGMAMANNSNPVLTNVTFSNNSAGSGGGMSITDGSIPTLTNVTFSSNIAITGGGIYNENSNSALTNVTLSGNSATSHGGGIYTDSSTLNVTNTTFTNNSAEVYGGGIYNFSSTVIVTNSTFSGSTATCGGGIYNDGGTLTVTNTIFSGNAVTCEGGGIFSDGTLNITNSTFVENFALDGGGIYNFGTLTVNNSTFSGNSTATYYDGGGIFNSGTGDATVTNSTFFNNSAEQFGGGIFNAGNLAVTNSTFSGNSAAVEGGGIYNFGSLHLENTILANSINGSDCYNESSDAIATNTNNLIESNGPSGSMCGTPAFAMDPMLGVLNGFPSYFPLISGSPAINTGDDNVCATAPVSNTSQNGVIRPQGSHCDIGSYEYASSLINVSISGILKETFSVLPGTNSLRTYQGFSGGPVLIDSTNDVPVVSSLRLLYNNKTFGELMGVPTDQLSNDYWLPYYRNVPGTDTQIRFTNTDDTLSTTVNVYLGNNPTAVYTKVLAASSTDRINLPSGTTGGPVHIVGTSGINILAGMRVIYGGNKSFDELMAFPTAELSTEYWFPFYNHNNVNLDTEVRVANTSSTNSVPVQIYIGDTLMDTTTIAPLSAYLKSFPGINGGPVRVVSTSGTPVPIVASLRLLYNNKTFSELMGVPTSQLSNDYWLPYYANIPGTDTQIRFTNTSDTLSTTVNVYLGSNPTPVYTNTLLPETADRFNLPSGTTGGPVHIVGTSGVNILAGMRVIYGGNSSFDELMAYPDAMLSAEYWFPFYNHNNVNLNTELRIGVP